MSRSASPEPGVCPVTGHRMPEDGRPLTPSPFFAERHREGRVHPLEYPDGHDGLLVTDFAVAQSVLTDPRFTVGVHRFPAGDGAIWDPDLDDPDQRAMASANLLAMDGEQHLRLRRMLTGRLSIKAVGTRIADIERIVAEELDGMLGETPPVDLHERFAERVSTRVHSLVLGIPADRVDDYLAVVVHGDDGHAKWELVRELVAHRRREPGDDLLSDLVASPELTDDEVHGLLMVLMTSGRDSVAYTIATTIVALLSHPEQLQRLRENPAPARLVAATEEFVRSSSMFLSLFPRTATEDLELAGCPVAAGQTVAVSQVAANHDPLRWEHPDDFDVDREAFGHLGFGFGPHGCIGQQLARAEIRTAIGALLERVPSLRLVDADQLRAQPFAHDVPTYRAGRVLVTW